MKNFSRLFSTAFFLGQLFLTSADAAVFTLPQLSTSQTDPIFKNLAADLAYRPVEGAALLATRKGGFGFQLGVTAIATDTSSISSIIGGSTPYLPGATFDIDFGFPFGFGIEFGFVPNLTYSGTTFGNYGGDIRWNFNQFFYRFPLDLALRGMYTTSSLASVQLISGASVTVNYGSTQTGVSLTIGKTLSALELYLGIGAVNQTSTLSYSGTVSLFGSTFPSGITSVSGSALGMWYTAGCQLRLEFLALGVQYDNILGIASAAAKLGFRI